MSWSTELFTYRSGASGIDTARSRSAETSGPNGASGSSPVTLASDSRCRPDGPTTSGPCSVLITATKLIPSWFTSPGIRAGQRSVMSSIVSRRSSAAYTRPRLPDPRTTRSEPAVTAGGAERRWTRSAAPWAARPRLEPPAGQIGQETVQATPALDRLLDGFDLCRGQLRADGGEVDPVPIGEDRSLGLPVVGQDDQPVRPRRCRGDLLQARQHVIEPIERGQRLRPQAAGVMGHLVVVDIVDVHGPRATDHLLGHQRGVEVPQYDVRHGPHAGEEPAAVSPWANVAATLPPGLEPLPGDLRDRPEQAAREPVRPGEVPGDAATRIGGTPLELDLAHRQYAIARRHR